jgi:hypothetical protein
MTENRTYPTICGGSFLPHIPGNFVKGVWITWKSPFIALFKQILLWISMAINLAKKRTCSEFQKVFETVYEKHG